MSRTTTAMPGRVTGGETSDARGRAIWDSDPALSAAPHSELLLPHADPDRTIVDLGCGNGTQTRYLATRFARAVGVDLSHAAVEHARRAANGAAPSSSSSSTSPTPRPWRPCTGGSATPMSTCGPSSTRANRPRGPRRPPPSPGSSAARAVPSSSNSPPAPGTCCGERRPNRPARRPSSSARLPARPQARRRPPDEEIPRLLAEAGLTVLAEGETTLPQTEYLADGTRIDLPAHWFVLGRA